MLRWLPLLLLAALVAMITWAFWNDGGGIYLGDDK